jgi:hypothetical protein
MKNIDMDNEELIDNLQDAAVLGKRDSVKELLRRLEEGEKYKAFWEQSREADKMAFEKYVWNTIHAKPLPEDMNKVLNDNLNDLYEK